MDNAQLRQLDDRFQELVLLFASELPDRVAALEEAERGGDQQELRRLSHQLKGAAGGYGFPRVSALAACLEQRGGEDNDLDEQVLRQLEAECREAAALSRPEPAGVAG